MSRTLHIISLNKILLLIVAVIFIVFWFAVIQSIFSNIIEDSAFFGIVITLLGLFLSILNKEIGSQFYKSVIYSRFRFRTSFWKNFGENNTQKLYLIIGTITALAGIIIIILSFYLKIEGDSGKI